MHLQNRTSPGHVSSRALVETTGTSGERRKRIHPLPSTPSRTPFPEFRREEVLRPCKTGEQVSRPRKPRQRFSMLGENTTSPITRILLKRSPTSPSSSSPRLFPPSSSRASLISRKIPRERRKRLHVQRFEIACFSKNVFWRRDMYMCISISFIVYFLFLIELKLTWLLIRSFAIFKKLWATSFFEKRKFRLVAQKLDSNGNVWIESNRLKTAVLYMEHLSRDIRARRIIKSTLINNEPWRSKGKLPSGGEPIHREFHIHRALH